jgi:hypothetical protein
MTTRRTIERWATFAKLGAPPRPCASRLNGPVGGFGTGTGYNPGGFVFYNYGITGSGTGPRSASRTIDAQVSYGPIAQ